MANWSSENDNSEKPNPGLRVGRLYKIVELGTQTDEYEGQTKRNAKVMITFELAAPMMADGRPFSISKEYTQSLGEKATLRKHLESWKGQAMTEQEHKDFDPKKLLGKVGCLNLTLTARGKIKIDSISGLMEGMAKPEPFNPQSYFSMDDFDVEAFQAMPNWIKAKIESSPEYKALHAAGGHEDGPPPPAAPLSGIDPKTGKPVVNPDDIPF
jgi:hypothetical protein